MPPTPRVLPAVKADSHHVDLWHAELPLPGLSTACLSPEEQARAARFYRPLDRLRWASTRAWLRTILAAYLDTDPAVLTFVYGPHGKPSLAPPWDVTQLQFNLSHSGPYAVCAVALGLPVGVDVECLRENVPIADIVTRFFAPAEAAVITSLTGDAQTRLFGQAWTAKEAYLKALGTGITQGLSHCTLNLSSIGPPVLATPGSWHLHTWHPWPGIPAALVAAGDTWLPRSRSFAV